MNKVKDAVTGHHKGRLVFCLYLSKLSRADLPSIIDTTGTGLEHEHGSQSGVHDKPLTGSSVAHGDHTSPTNPGVLHSTQPGIHGERDSGATGSGLSNTGLTGQGSGLGGSHSGSVAHGDSISPTNPGVLHSTKPGIHGARDAGIGGSGLSNAELRQDEGVGSGLTSGSRSGYDSTTGTTGTHGTHGTHGTSGQGPHSSGLANKADPRVDSDRDGSRGLGATTGGVGNTHNAGPQYTGSTRRDEGLVGSGVDTTGRGSGLTGSDTRDIGLGGNRSGYDSGVTGTHGTHGTGPHSSGLVNKADPRVDSDRDGSRGLGATGTTGGYGSGTTGSGLTGDRSGYDTGVTGGSTGGHGPHSSGLANKADPRVDSDLDGSRNHGATGTTGGYSSGTTGSGLTGDRSGYGSGATGGTTGVGGQGPHSSGLANKADPRVDSDRDGSRNLGASGTGTTGGYGSSTTGSGLTGQGTGHHTGSSGFTGEHRRGDGHPEDIVHPGPHHTQTAKALDPHLNP